MGRWDDYNDAWDEADIAEQKLTAEAHADRIRADRELADDLYWASIESEQEWAARYTEAWDKLEPHGILEPNDYMVVTLADLERLAAYLPNS